MAATTLYNIPLGACTKDPDRWTTTPDAEAKALCRACPRRWRCAARPSSQRARKDCGPAS
jgi:WhiB family redox-sensing transcriptional regulator